jgi:hypothetical protein
MLLLLSSSSIVEAVELLFANVNVEKKTKESKKKRSGKITCSSGITLPTVQTKQNMANR